MSRFHTILVAIDFSEAADAALDCALAIAKESHADVHLLHSYEIPLGAIPPYGVEVPAAVVIGVRDAAARQLERAERKARERGATCQSHLEHGLPSSSIVEKARAIHADLIVMGTRGLTGVKHVLLGSVAERTARTAPCPVLTVKPGTGSELRCDRVLVPVDFSTHAEAALALAIELAKPHGGTIDLLHAYELPAAVTMAYGLAIPQSVWDGVQQAGAKRLGELAGRVTAAGLPVETHLVTAPAADAIVEAATTHPADLIVLGTRGLSGLKHVLLGSVAERTIRLAPCPVITVKAAEPN